MKKTIGTLITAALLALPLTIQAQENPPVIAGPGVDAFNFLTTPAASNWMVATYAIKPKTAGWGAGLGAFYSVNNYVGATLRADFFDHSFWMPQGNIQFQAPVTIMGKLTAIPFLTTGLAAQIAGRDNQQGKVVGVFGMGLAIRLNPNDKWYVPDDVFAGYEKWSDGHGSGTRFGFTWKF